MQQGCFGGFLVAPQTSVIHAQAQPFAARIFTTRCEKIIIQLENCVKNMRFDQVVLKKFIILKWYTEWCGD